MCDIIVSGEAAGEFEILDHSCFLRVRISHSEKRMIFSLRNTFWLWSPPNFVFPFSGNILFRKRFVKIGLRTLTVLSDLTTNFSHSVPPSLDGTNPINHTITEGTIMTLLCNVTTANPAPTITWTSTADNGRVYPNGATLTLNVTRRDSGQYGCVADNGVKMAAVSHFAHINVECKSIGLGSGWLSGLYGLLPQPTLHFIPTTHKDWGRSTYCLDWEATPDCVVPTRLTYRI